MIKVQLFGRFTVISETGTLCEDTLHSSRLTSLLAYIIVNRDKDVTLENIAEAVLNPDTVNIERTVRNLLYRLRPEMEVLGDEEFICTMRRAYRWNPAVKVETDYGELERMGERLRILSNTISSSPVSDSTLPAGTLPTGTLPANTLPAGTLLTGALPTNTLPTSANNTEEEYRVNTVAIKSQAQKIITLYGTGVSRTLTNSAWAQELIECANNTYLEAVKALTEVYEQEGSLIELEQLWKDARKNVPANEDLHCLILKSLCRRGDLDRASRFYEDSRKTLGSEPKKLQKIYREMALSGAKTRTNLKGLIRDMQEIERPGGPFFCDYQIFRMLYRVEARKASRQGISEQIMLVTFRNAGKYSVEKVTEEMDSLVAVLSMQLREGDVASKVNISQVLVMLSDCTYENCKKVAGRINKAWKRSAIQGMSVEKDGTTKEKKAETSAEKNDENNEKNAVERLEIVFDLGDISLGTGL